MRNAEIIKDIARLVQMSFKGQMAFRNKEEAITKEYIKEKVEYFNKWNNDAKYYDFALNLTEEEKEAVFNQVCSWAVF